MKSQDDTCRGCRGRALTQIGEKDGFTLLRCGDCKTVIAAPLPSGEDLTRYYQNHAKSACYRGKTASKMRRALKRVKRLLRAGAKGKTFLDVGCNIGTMVGAAGQAGLVAFGIDIDDEAIHAARRNFPGGRFECVLLEDLAARGDSFDFVYASEVIEHVRDPDSFVTAAAKVLKPGGLLYLTCPDGAHFGVPRDFATWGMVCPPEHLTFFSRQGMRALLTRCGLHAEKFQLAFKPGMKVFARKMG